MVAVVSYWVGESGETQVWLYENYSEAIKGMNRLLSLNLKTHLK